MDLVTPQQSPADPQPELPPVNTNQSMVMPPKKKKTGKILLIILVIVLLLGGGAAAYWKFFKKPAKNTKQTTTETAQESKELTNHNFFQLGNKVISYDNIAKKAETLTDKLPADATILDLFADKETWRLYYTVPAASKQQLFYLEKDGTAQKLVESSNLFVSASAEAKVAAYTDVFSNDEGASADAKTNRTYVVKDGKSTLVLQSKDKSVNVASTDYKSSKYGLVDISPDGKKLLLGLFSCFYCDGPQKSTAFELTIDGGAYEFVQQSEDSGTVRNARDGKGFVITKSTSSELGFSDEPYNISIFSLDKVGGTLTPVFSANEKNWGYVAIDQKAVYPIVEKRLQNYAETGKTSFDAVYYRSGTNVASLTKMELTGLDISTLKFNELGEKSGSCSGVWVGTRDPKTTRTNEVGVLCYADTTHAAYTKVDGVTKNLSDTTQTYFQIL